MPGLVVPLKMGQLTINPSGTNPGEVETNMRAPSWALLDMSFVWQFPELRGENTILPGVAGRYAFEQVIDQTDIETGLVIVGDATHAGASTADTFVGLRANRDWLMDNVHTPNGATRVAKLHQGPFASPLLADVQCKITLGRMVGPTLRAVFKMTLVDGEFT